MEEKESKTEGRVDQNSDQELDHELEMARLKKEHELELAKHEAAKQKLKTKLLEQELYEKEQAAEQRIAEEEESERQKKIAIRQDRQADACDDYVGSKYEELELNDGKVLKGVKVTAANAVNVSFIHRSGVARVEYSNLPREIRDTCLYDKELEEVELERRAALEQKRRERIASRTKSSESKSKTSSQDDEGSASNKRTASRSRDTKEETKEKVKVRPRGSLTIRVVGSGRGGKVIEVIARSNVDARLYLNDYYRPYRYTVKANSPYRHTWRYVRDKYEVRLEHNGVILDQEGSGRKSGLGGAQLGTGGRL